MAFFGALAFLILLLKIPAPYGRHSMPPGHWSAALTMSTRLAWFLQELPAFAISSVCLWNAPTLESNLVNRMLLCYFILHYFQRTFIFPALIRESKPTPIYICFLAFVFCVWNGWLQSRSLTLHVRFPAQWTTQPCFILGSVAFVFGLVINVHSDHILRSLRKPGETAYKIPRGGMFDYVSGANFLGEIIEWCGFAVACWTPYAAAFAFFTICNIGPRALSHHQWYLKKFGDDYPRSRKALIPFVL
ncbi:hypothetical protein CAPTEDRAFT_153061 [Capitella teleta]|uniref:3-oxo-5alpha-steroid 4-dehydrogenase (NADP(+)) n=1 Tax=Capitella teleta TaxID=283909 RepID=R7TNA9_CAPTE|nr:hypothetical protein CAPTEDRAFT_153061 [Capitella teleta]|eukprot:ELT93041.1 hypothetical protein CAPTEDRAFT_153061 [Capitella teleta]